MPKLIRILVASIGGGLVLGAGIRLGEAIAARLPASRTGSRDRLVKRLGGLEDRPLGPEPEYPAASDVPRAQLDTEHRQFRELSETSQRLQTRLRMESDRGQKQMLDAFAESVQTRVVQRISKLEEEVAGHSAAMSELREYSLRTERSMQKLLGGLDRFIVKNAPAPDPPTQSGPPPAAEPPVKSSR